MFIKKLNEALASKKSFLSEPLNFASFGVSALLIIIHWVILYIKVKPSRGNVLLHFNVVYGADLVGKSLYLYLLPAIALTVIVINAFLTRYFYKREKLASYFVAVATIPVQLVFFIATIVLIIANDK